MKSEMSKKKKKKVKERQKQKEKRKKEKKKKQSKHHSTSANFDFGQFDFGQLAEVSDFSALKSVDQIAGLNLNHQNCCCVEKGSESCQFLLGWAATNCEEFSEMNSQIRQVRRRHDWTGGSHSLLDGFAKKKSFSGLTQNLVQTKQPSKLPYKALKQARTMLYPTPYFSLAPRVALDPACLGFTLNLAASCRFVASSNILTKGPEKIQAARGYDLASIFALSSDWVENL